jgi:hypothetical protein
MLDLRKTDSHMNMGDLIEVSLEFARHREVFKNKIAVIIPNTEERLDIARHFKACMDIQGFDFRQLTDFESAIEWLSEET